MKKILSTLCISFLCLGSVGYTVPTKIDKNCETVSNQIQYTTNNETAQSKLNQVLTNKVRNISDNEELTIEITKSLKDFNGKEYILTECYPSGYTIFYPEIADFVESSPNAPSPYKDLFGELYYAGPTEYYICEKGQYRHTITGEIIEQSDLVVYKTTSQQLSEELSEYTNDTLLEYIENDNIGANEFISYSSPSLMSSSSNGLAPDRVQWFKDLYQCGYTQSNGEYNGYGCCGFIALGMIYAYFDKFIDDKYIDNTYWVDYKKTNLKNGIYSFSYELHRRDPKDGTTSMHIDTVSKNYLKDRGINDCKHTDLWTPFFTKSKIKSKIDNGYPVIIFGNLADPPGYGGGGKKAGHAVVAYSYSGNDFTCHYGWDSYTDVTIKGTFGSIYCMELK